MSRPNSISMADLAFCYELYQEGLSWKRIESHIGYLTSTIIKSLKRAGAVLARASTEVFSQTQDYIDMWHRGWSCTRLAEIARVSKDTMSRGLRSLGLDPMSRPKPVIDEAIKECLRLRAEGVVMRDIVDIVGYSERHIQRWLNPKVVEQGAES